MRTHKWLLLALGALLLAGCSLARAEDGAASGGDRWIGFYVMRETGREQFHDNPYLTEYGSRTLETKEYGSFQIPRQILLAEEADTGYRFPGMEGGFSLFCVRREEDFGPVLEMVSNMGLGDQSCSTHVSDTGSEDYISGTVYSGPPAGAVDWDKWDDRSMWTAYRVFQSPAGDIYLDGSGNSYQMGGGGSFEETSSYTYAEDGETVKEQKLTVKVFMETVPRLEKLVVTQYDKNNTVLRSEEANLEEEISEIICEADTTWVLVEEVSTDGTAHSVYDIPAEDGEALYHSFAVLDGSGMGSPRQLRITGPS